LLWYKYPALSFRGRIYEPEKPVKKYDVILVSGDAYVDHPAFPVAVIARRFQQLGLSVAVIAQPDWTNDQDFTAFGSPELFFAIVPGAMDSMVANFTAAGMPRGEDRLSPGGQAGLRPKRALQVYVQKIRQLFSGCGILIGGIEASLRRFVHYDFWEDKLRDPVLHDAAADLLVYGMAESVLKKVVEWFAAGRPAFPEIAQTCIRVRHNSWKDLIKKNFLLLPSVAECKDDKITFFRFSKTLDTSVRPGGKILIQQHPKGDVICFPPAMEDLRNETDIMSTLEFNRRTHPLYDKPVPGLEPVQFSVQSHRGCLGSCSFCALAIHQGRFIRSRQPEDILKEIARFADHPDFRGIIPDIGGPAVNMYGWECRIGSCEKNACVFPRTCQNIRHSLKPLAEILRAASQVSGVRKVFLGSGLRYDLVRDDEWDVFEYIVFNHVSGQLKVAPEHFSRKVLELMRKGPEADFSKFATRFYDACRRKGHRLFLVPYLMTAFPGSGDEDKMLAKKISELHLAHEQIQEFTPTPGSLGSAMFYSGLDLNEKPIKVLKKHGERLQGRKMIQGGKFSPANSRKKR